MNCVHEHMNMPDERSFGTGVYGGICYSLLKLIYYSSDASHFEFTTIAKDQPVKFVKSYDRSELFGNSMSGHTSSILIPATKIDGEVCLKFVSRSSLPFFTTNPMEARRRMAADMLRWADWILEQMRSKKSVKQLRRMKKSELMEASIAFELFEKQDKKEVAVHSFTTSVSEILRVVDVLVGKSEDYIIKSEPNNPMELMKETLLRAKLSAIVETLRKEREELRKDGKDYSAICCLKLKKFFTDNFPELTDSQVAHEMSSLGFLGYRI